MSFNDLNETFNVDGEVVHPEVSPIKPKKITAQVDDIKKDYEYTRGNLYSIIEKGQEAIDLMLDLARESEHPRAFEVLSNMLKQNAEIADKLMTLQKQKKEVKKTDTPELPNNLTQNNVFVGSTTDMQRMLQSKMDSMKVIDDDSE